MPVWLIIILTGAVSGAIFSVYNGDDGEICVETTVFAFVRTIIERVIMFFIFILGRFLFKYSVTVHTNLDKVVIFV